MKIRVLARKLRAAASFYTNRESTRAERGRKAIRCAVEGLESRLFLSATVPAGFVEIGSASVCANSQSPTKILTPSGGTITFQPGETYFVIGTGACIIAAGPRLADAGSAQHVVRGEFINGYHGLILEIGTGTIASTFTANSAAWSDGGDNNHVWGKTLTDESGTAAAMYHDIANGYYDNSGSLEVGLYEKVRLNSLTATDEPEVSLTATASNSSTKQLYVPADARTASFSLQASVDGPSGAGTFVRWTVKTHDILFASGNFSGPADVDLALASPSDETDYVVTARVAANGECPSAATTETIDVHVVKLRLDILTSSLQPLSETAKNTTGGFVVLNDDDDNHVYDSNGNPIPDDSPLKTGSIDGEKDLVPIGLHAGPAELGGRYELEWTSSKISIWAHANKAPGTDANGTSFRKVISGSTEFDATKNTLLYVEGDAVSTGAAQEAIKLVWVGASGPLTADGVKFTVHNVSGPTVVPEYGIYQYTADVPGQSSGEWGSDGGNLISVVDDSDEPANATIHWLNGPAQGEVIFSPAEGFTCMRDVDIVQLTIRQGGVDHNDPYFTGSAAEQYPGGGYTDPNGVPRAIMTAHFGGEVELAAVSPRPAGSDADEYDLSQITAGFVINVEGYVCHGFYNNGAEENISSLESACPLLDQADSSPAGTAWADLTGYTDFGIIHPSAVLSLSDSPAEGPPLYSDQGTTQTANNYIMGRMRLQFNFRMDIAATTSQAPSTYVREFSAEYQFNGDAVRSNGVLNPSPEAGLTVPSGWGGIVDGSTPDRTSGTTFNQATKTETFLPVT